jgi:hypothetical protein
MAVPGESPAHPVVQLLSLRTDRQLVIRAGGRCWQGEG